MKLPFAALVAAAALLAAAPRADAHPLGNNSITHFSVLKLLPDRLEVDLLLDFAEGPAGQLRRSEMDADADGDDTPEEQQAWLNRKAEEWAPLLSASFDGQTLAFSAVPSNLETADGEVGETTRLVMKIPGFGGMPTYRVIVRYAAPYPIALGTAPRRLDYTDTSYTGTPGLRRILLERSSAATFTGSRPPFWDEGTDPFLYEQYDPGNLPDERSTTFTFALTPAAAEAAAKTSGHQKAEAASASVTQPAADSLPRIIGSFTDPRNNPAKTAEYYRQADRLITMLRGRWGITILLTVTALSFVWGAAHALMPGHAKTVVAAYLISQHGTYRHAVLLAIIVTVTHTALVVILGLVIWFYQASHPELGPKLQLWLGTLAGVLVGAMGLTLIWRAVTGRIGHHHRGDHAHGHAHEHDHHHAHAHDHPHEHEHHHAHDHGHDHSHAHGHEHAHTHDHSHEHRSWVKKLFTHSHTAPTAESSQLTTRTLLILGITGGIVPCPTATIIMLLGIGANVVLGALYAVGVFSLGLALTLMAIGFAALSSRRVARRLLSDAAHEGELSAAGRRLLLQAIPAGSGLLVLALGAAITAHYIHLLRTGQPLFGWMG